MKEEQTVSSIVQLQKRIWFDSQRPEQEPVCERDGPRHRPGLPRGEHHKHEHEIQAVSFCLDGQVFASGSDRAVRLWKVSPAAPDDPDRVRFSAEPCTGRTLVGGHVRPLTEANCWSGNRNWMRSVEIAQGGHASGRIRISAASQTVQGGELHNCASAI